MGTSFFSLSLGVSATLDHYRLLARVAPALPRAFPAWRLRQSCLPILAPRDQVVSLSHAHIEVHFIPTCKHPRLRILQRSLAIFSLCFFCRSKCSGFRVCFACNHAWEVSRNFTVSRSLELFSVTQTDLHNKVYP